MLVLNKRKGESVMIGGDIEVTIVDIRQNTVRLGIIVPSGTPVHRKETYIQYRKGDEKEAAQERPGEE